MLTRAGARREEEERARAAFDSIPNDIIVSIFASVLAEPEFVLSPKERDRRRSNNLRWVRETFPLVCKGWRDLYRSQQASPLHETLDIDFEDETGLVPSLTVSAEAVIAWARTRDVRRLRVNGSFRRSMRELSSSEQLATIIEAVAPHLDEIEVVHSYNSHVEAPFFRALREFIAPVGRLRKLSVEQIVVPLSQEDVAFLGQLTRLEELELRLGLLATLGGENVGLRAFPESVLAITNLRHLDLSYNDVPSLPPGISSLQRLESLNMHGCCLSSLPEELGELRALTRVDVGRNMFDESEAVAFPAAALRGLTRSLRHLAIDRCNLRSIPSFIGELRCLESLDVSGNRVLGENERPPHFALRAPLPVLPTLTRLIFSMSHLASVPTAVLSSMSQLRVLDLHMNSLASLPEEFGQRLTQLREVVVSLNRFEALPLRALAGARNLEKINCTHGQLQVEEPLDWLLEEFPRLREVRLSETSGGHPWTPTSRANIERFAAALRERDPTAIVMF